MSVIKIDPVAPGLSGSRDREPVIVSENIGVKYAVGTTRENLQSRVFNSLLGKGNRRVFWALEKLSFTGYDGDIIGVVGPNGSGKSTLCKVISGLLRPDRGTIRVKGKVSALLSLGTGFNYQLSGRENIYLNAMMLGFTRTFIDSIFDEIVEFSGLGTFIDEPLKNYSSGMKARLAFSVGAMMEPDVLILDEALSAGDIEFSERAGKKLQQIIKRSKIVIVVTHNMGFVERYCTSALWIEGGALRASGDPVQVVREYKASVKTSPRVPRKINLTQPSFKIGTQPVVTVKNLGLKFQLKNGKASRGGAPPCPKGGRPACNGEFWPLKAVDFTVNQGEVVGIIGRNGEGKTTLCRILSGILKPDRGDVVVNGSTTALLTFGAGFNIQLSGHDNIFLNGLMLGIPKKQLKSLYPDIVSFAELEAFVSEPVKNYSNGMRSRLGFSIASMISPDVFIIDEALNAGDISFYEKASTKIQEIMEKAKAVIVVTHSLAFVKQVCNRALWIDGGEIKFDGDPDETVKNYVSSVAHLKEKDKGV